MLPQPPHSLYFSFARARRPPGRLLALLLARLGREWRQAAAARMPTATGDIREIVGQPVFVPLYNLYLRYGKIFRLRCAMRARAHRGGAAPQAARARARIAWPAQLAAGREQQHGGILTASLVPPPVLHATRALRAAAVLLCSFGPKSFVIISDPAYAKQILYTNADKYSKGLLR